MSGGVKGFGRWPMMAVLGTSLVLAGCQTTGQGATTGAMIGGLGGCAVGAAVADNSGQGCLIGGLFGAVAGAIIGDAIEREQQKKIVYQVARSGRGGSTGTFKNSKGQRVRYTAKVKKTYKKPSDSELTCREIEYAKQVDGSAAGTGSDTRCQVRLAGKPSWGLEDDA